MAHREARKPLVIDARCTTAEMLRDVTVTDLSRKGCRIKTNGLELRVGESVAVRLEGLESLLATVRWIDGQFMGIEFDYPLHSAVVDHLCRIHPCKGRCAGDF